MKQREFTRGHDADPFVFVASFGRFFGVFALSRGFVKQRDFCFHFEDAPCDGRSVILFGKPSRFVEDFLQARGNLLGEPHGSKSGIVDRKAADGAPHAERRRIAEETSPTDVSFPDLTNGAKGVAHIASDVIAHDLFRKGECHAGRVEETIQRRLGIAAGCPVVFVTDQSSPDGFPKTDDPLRNLDVAFANEGRIGLQQDVGIGKRREYRFLGFGRRSRDGSRGANADLSGAVHDPVHAVGFREVAIDRAGIPFAKNLRIGEGSHVPSRERDLVVFFDARPQRKGVVRAFGSLLFEGIEVQRYRRDRVTLVFEQVAEGLVEIRERRVGIGVGRRILAFFGRAQDVCVPDEFIVQVEPVRRQGTVEVLPEPYPRNPVVRIDYDDEPVAVSPGSSGPLKEGLGRRGRPDHDDESDVSDVDSEFQRARRHDAPQASLHQGLLDFGTALVFVAGSVGQNARLFDTFGAVRRVFGLSVSGFFFTGFFFTGTVL